MADKQTVEVGGRRLALTNLDKVLYPGSGTTKAEVVDYYVRVADVLLPHLADRPVTRKRWPDGTSKEPFFEKNAPAGTPSWVRTVTLPTPGSSTGRETITFPFVDDLPSLVWVANLAALELHVPQWRVGPRGGVRDPDRLVIDLDPGPPAGLDECAEVALMVRERLAEDGLETFPVTSGSKGMQLYAPVAAEQDSDVMRDYARTLAESLTHDHRHLVVASMTKAIRPGKVLLDWSQNHAAKTTIAPYSLRGRERPTVAAPRTWEEVEAGGLRQLSAAEVLERLAADGDLTKALHEPGPRVPV